MAMRSKPRNQLIAIVYMLLACGVLASCSQPEVQNHIATSSEDFQEKLLEGGITDAEYRLAAEAMVDCIDNAGLSGKWYFAEDGVTITIGVSPPDPVPAEESPEAIQAKVSSVYQKCAASYWYRVQMSHQGDHVLTGSARDGVMADLIACLESVGVTGVLPSDGYNEVAEKFGSQLSMAGKPPDAGARCFGRYASLLWDSNEPQG